ncbi:DUF461 domain-containing protein [Streptomyces pratensis]|uniref:DUF461 domain-containing protein n=1 Tax=Streptomyces pratensis TaxID=1169025 RepID=UPI00301A568A
MSRSLRHGALAATALAFSIVSLSACGAGNDAQTLKVRPDNAATSVGTIKVQNANVITQSEDDAKGPAVVTATLFNDGTQEEVLEAVTLPGSDAQVKLQAADGKGPIEIPPGGQVIIGGEGNAAAVIEDGHEAVNTGGVQQVVFKLSRTGDVGLGAGVFPAKGPFEDFGPSPQAEAPAQEPSGDAESSATPEGETPGAAADPAAGSGVEGGEGDTATQGAGDSASQPAAH